MGRNNLLNWGEDGSQTLGVQQIYVHPDFQSSDTSSFDADLALVQLNTLASFSSTIRPICLWDQSTEIDDMVNKQAVVAGWGKTERGELSTVPNKLSIKVVSDAECMRSNFQLSAILTNRAFCAGNRDGSSPCNGDSGGPLMINRNGAWYIRGIVSISLQNEDRTSCDPYNYIFFTNVAKFIPWIRSHL